MPLRFLPKIAKNRTGAILKNSSFFRNHQNGRRKGCGVGAKMGLRADVAVLLVTKH